MSGLWVLKLSRCRFVTLLDSNARFYPAGRRAILQEVQAPVRGCPGQELPDQLPRHELDHRQAQVHGQEVADPHRGSRRRQDHRRIPLEVLLHRLHPEAVADPEVLLRPEPAGEHLSWVLPLKLWIASPVAIYFWQLEGGFTYSVGLFPRISL